MFALSDPTAGLVLVAALLGLGVAGLAVVAYAGARLGWWE